ncbi:MAG: hypothetical protein Fur0012_12430 [Elusimicrobiota bacterium]
MKLKILLILQILFFAVFGGWLYINREGFVSEFWLETAPVDPRDLLSGTYVALRYVQEEKVSKCAEMGGLSDYSLWVEFAPSQKNYKLSDGRSGAYYEAINCSSKPVYEKNWAKIKFYYHSHGKIKPLFPDRYYLNEKDSRKDLRSSQAAVRVRVQRDKTLTLVELADLEKSANSLINSTGTAESGSI